ncbi:MAG: Na+/H+ antiporter NhaA [Gammaproteobacteria bacterium]|nr:Na+/H+ antiporter NhaA [Gammaproteobacteria bacterium]
MKNFIMITLGTGLGSGLVVNGDLVYGHDGFAGELGHVRAVANGRQCGCGNRGCMETYVSATGIKRTIYELLAEENIDSEFRNIPYTKLNPKLITAKAEAGDPIAIKGWAIPSATDIAFALGVLALLGSRIPQALKLFLMTLAIIDDLGAIIIIALFYTADLSITSLLIAVIAVSALFALNRKGVLRLTPYLFIGFILWAAVLKSGVHATLAGVLTAFFIPFKSEPGESQTQLEKLEHDLHPTVAYGILPLFAFANAGISFGGITIDSFLHPVPMGIAAGLFFGNQLGIFGFCWLAIKIGLAKLPEGVSWAQLYGVTLLCGIGFTMSLFIGSLAFEQSGPDYAVDDRLGILLGSLLSGILGYIVLRYIVNSSGSSTKNS